MSGRLASAVGTAAVAVLWGTSGVLVRQTTLPAAQIACARAAIGAAVLGLWIWAMPHPAQTQVRRSLAGRQAALAVSSILLAAHWLTFVMALQRIPIGTVLLGVYLAPLAVTALAHRILGEPITIRLIAALTAAIVGSIVALQPDKTTGWEGLALIGFSALTYAGSIVASKRALASAAPVAVTTGQLGLVALILAPLVVLDPSPVGTRDLIVLLTLGLVYSAIAQLAYLAFLRELPATTSATLLLLEPGSAFTAGWLALGETPALSTLVGTCLVLAAGVLAIIDSTHAQSRPVRPIQ